MANTTQKEFKGLPFSDEDVCIVSKAGPCIIWAGTKVMYSGGLDGSISGNQFLSGESDMGPISISGFGQIRIPELNQLHKIFVFPKDPTLIAREDYTWLDTTVGASGLPNGHGGCSGKMALVHYSTICSGCYIFMSGTEHSGAFNVEHASGVYDIIAFGSQF